jgi:hypothetical protein
LLEQPLAWHIATNDPALAPAANADATNAVNTAPGGPSGPIGRLLGQRMLALLQDTVPAQTAWQTMARAGLPTDRQPSGATMQHLCNLRHLWRSTYPTTWDASADWQWLWCTWLGHASAQPLETATTGPIDWGQAPWRERAQQLQRLLREEPDRDLRTHFENLI